MSEKIEISVIVPTLNRAASLARALASFVTQDMDPDLFEVLVVDNGSSDDTQDVAESFEGKIKQLRYVHEPEPGLHCGRHRGLREARGDLLVYADDDIAAFSTWLSAIRRSFRDSNVALVGGKILPEYEDEPPYWLRRLWRRRGQHGRAMPYLSILDFGETSLMTDPYYIWGCNFGVRREAVLKAGGFHPDGMPPAKRFYRGDGETWISDVVVAKEWRALYEPDASVYHYIPAARMTQEYFFQRAYDEGISYSYTVLRHQYLMHRGLKVHMQAAVAVSRRVRKLKIAHLMKRILSHRRVGDDWTRIKRDLYRHGVDGWRAHRQQCRADRALRDWVAQESYM